MIHTVVYGTTTVKPTGTMVGELLSRWSEILRSTCATPIVTLPLAGCMQHEDRRHIHIPVGHLGPVK